MKIVHTADWHIGKILHRQELKEDFILFFNWLIEFITIEKVDVLLVSGDIFDLSNPANSDIRLYYQVLHRLSELKVKVILTGGNHDSVSLLDGPFHLLNSLNITVTGGLKDNLDDHIIPCFDGLGQLGCVVLAVPFLRDRDLRISYQAGIMPQKSTSTIVAIKQIYDALIDKAKVKYGNDIPVIAMGHLFMQGSLTSESEREIHVGNLDGVPADIISHQISYMALGHIHKPQIIGRQNHIRYCGSPVFLDFSEREYAKMVILIETNPENDLEIKPVMIPKNRDIIRISGNLNQVSDTLRAYNNPYPLTTFIELDIKESEFDITKVKAAEDLVNSIISDDFKVLKSRIQFLNSNNDLQNMNVATKSIEELTPMEIFRQKLNESVIDDMVKDNLLGLYNTLMEELKN